MLGTSYAKGGVEYYDKQISSNIAQRTLNRAKGKDLFNLHGDPWPSLLRPFKYSVPTLRKQTCKQILESKNERNL